MSNPFINVPTIINTSCSPLKYLARFVINEIDTSQRVFTIRCSFSDLENGSPCDSKLSKDPIYKFNSLVP